jgi:hypothetical protein
MAVPFSVEEDEGAGLEKYQDGTTPSDAALDSAMIKIKSQN